MADLFITIFIVVLLSGTATVIKYFKGEGLISGYNTSSPEEQKYMLEKGIGKFVGNYLYLLAAVILCGYLAKKAGFAWGEGISWILFVIVLIIMLIRVRQFRPPGPPSRSARNSAVIGTIIIIIVLVGITWSALPSKYRFESRQFTITGAYGTSIKYEDIESIRLEDKIPPIAMRTNGLGLGPIAKGHFQLEGGKSVRLYLRSNRPPFLYITIENQQNPIIINLPKPEQTTTLYTQLNKMLGLE